MNGFLNSARMLRKKLYYSKDITNVTIQKGYFVLNVYNFFLKKQIIFLITCESRFKIVFLGYVINTAHICPKQG